MLILLLPAQKVSQDIRLLYMLSLKYMVEVTWHTMLLLVQKFVR